MVMRRIIILQIGIGIAFGFQGSSALSQNISFHFDSDPQWSGLRNRQLPESPPLVRQSFGYRSSQNAGGEKRGEIGGWIQRSVRPAWYAQRIETCSLEDTLEASGSLSVTKANNGSGALIGFFHHASRGWRTPNSLAFRVDGNGGKYWILFEYGTQRWKTGGMGTFEGRYQTTKTKPFLADGTKHDWSLRYDPNINNGQGQMVFVLDGAQYILPLETGHRQEGATFDRFGIWNMQVTGDGLELFLDDLIINGHKNRFDEDPKWEEVSNQEQYSERFVRPRNDFGFSETNFAGGEIGEIGGVIWRDPKSAYYGGKLKRSLSLEDRFHVEGKLALVSAASDSAVCFGFFDFQSRNRSANELDPNPGSNTLGILLEGLSRDGHYYRPTYATATGEFKTAERGPIVLPDGQPHRWSMDYDPHAAQGVGEITFTLDQQKATYPLAAGHRVQGGVFDGFGIYGWERSDGSFVEFYLDDVEISIPAPNGPRISTDGFRSGAHHWRKIRDESRFIQATPEQPRYSEDQFEAIATNILSFQRANGGWPKDYDMLAILTEEQLKIIRETHLREDTSYDNDNIHSQVEYLARAYTAFGRVQWREACERGVDFMLASQLPSGGFPQRFPKPKGYAAHITFNDGVMIGVLNVLKDIADREPHFTWIDETRRMRAVVALDAGIECILKCQISANDRLTGWCQQHDAASFEAASARTFELASICPQETTAIVRFLMRIDQPSKRIIGSIESAVHWLSQVQLQGISVKRVPSTPEEFQRHSADFDVVVVQEPHAPVIWARHYEIGSDRPVFAGRDAVKRYALAQIERERRTGTPWYGNWPERLLQTEYPPWKSKVHRH